MEETKSVDSPQISVRERAKIQAQLGNVKQQTVKLLTGKQGENKVLEEADMGDESFATKGTVYFKNCEDCEYTLNAESVKVLIEGCKRCKITINGHVKTEILEIWRCEGFSLVINTTIKTLQADMCPDLSIHIDKAESLGNIVWAGIKQLKISFGDSPESKLETGVEERKQEVPDLNPETDQFIVHFLEGKLKQELVVRLENGFPTTEREAQEFDEKSKANAERAEAFVRKLVAESKITIKSKEEVEKEKAQKEQEEAHEKEAGGETHAKEEVPKTHESPKAPAGDKPVIGEGQPASPGTHKEEEDRKKVVPEKKPSKKPERVYIGIDN